MAQAANNSQKTQAIELIESQEKQPQRAAKTKMKPVITVALVALAVFVQSARSQQRSPEDFQNFPSMRRVKVSQLVARRSADEARPITRVIVQPMSAAESAPVEAPIVMGRFRAPAPERMSRARVPKASNFGQHSVGASFRVADVGELADSTSRNNIVQDSRKNQNVERKVSASMQVSDEGLNYPPSKLSADIYGNVAEIVTAPPEAVESDLLMPISNRFAPSNRAVQMSG